MVGNVIRDHHSWYSYIYIATVRSYFKAGCHAHGALRGIGVGDSE